MAGAADVLAVREIPEGIAAPLAIPEASDPSLDILIDTIVEETNQQVEQWRETFLVSMSRASAMSRLKEGEIRYFEDLGVLQIAKSSERGSGNRQFSITDLRRLYALAFLRKAGRRPAEAADIVRRYVDCIDAGVHRNIAHLVSHENNAVTDGFLLARLLSQLLDATHAELAERGYDVGRTLRIRGAMLPLEAPPEAVLAHGEAVQEAGRRLAGAAQGMLVALSRELLLPAEDIAIPPPLTAAGRDDTTVLFYSPRAWELPSYRTCSYCLYVPQDRPDLALWLMIDTPPDVVLPAVLHVEGTARRALFDRLLALCEPVFREFSSSTLTKNYRYRSDGYQIAHTRATYSQVLSRIRHLVFPGDDQSMAALLIPDSLDRPSGLAILAHDHYPAPPTAADHEPLVDVSDLAFRARLSLSGEGQGLCGRAYNLREPFLSREADTDTRIAYGVEEGCRVAMAIPLATNWGLPPFGVLYLASRAPGDALTTEAAYTALILSSILSELLGRWWLTRLRRVHDARLHQRLSDTTRWLDSLSRHSVDFSRALDHLEGLWTETAACRRKACRQLTLVALDIDQYRRRVQQPGKDPLPLTAQMHVRQAVERICPGVPQYWCMNDHVLLVLPDISQAEAHSLVLRVMRFLAAAPSPLTDDQGRQIPVTVSAALASMTLQEILDLDPSGGKQLRCDLTLILDDLRARASLEGPQAVWCRTLAGWRRAGRHERDIEAVAFEAESSDYAELTS